MEPTRSCKNCGEPVEVREIVREVEKRVEVEVGDHARLIAKGVV